MPAYFHYCLHKHGVFIVVLLRDIWSSVIQLAVPLPTTLYSETTSTTKIIALAKWVVLTMHASSGLEQYTAVHAYEGFHNQSYVHSKPVRAN